MPRFTIATATALLLAATPLAAQDQSGDGSSAQPADQQSSSTQDSASAPAALQPSEKPQVMASKVMDAQIVSLEGNYDQTTWDGGDPLAVMSAGLTEIGEVADIALTTDGEMLGVLTDVGGFLGIGQKTVLIPLDDLRLTMPPEEGDGEITVITRLNQQQLNEAEAFQNGEN